MAEFTSPLPSEAPISYVVINGRRTPIYVETDAWEPYLRSLQTRIESTPTRLKTTPLTDQVAAIGTTPVEMPAIATGLYRVTYSLQQTRADGVSLILTVTIGWTRGAVPQADPGTALNANTVTTQQSRALLVRADEDTAITFAVAYVSGGGGPAGMFDFDIVVESIPESE